MEKKKNGKLIKKKNVKNIDLWLRIDYALKKHKVEWFWIKGHFGHLENEKCDIIARQSAQHPSIKDNYYENRKF